jgi:hypothetical protein
MLIADLHLAPRLRMSGVYLHSASMPPLLGRGQLHVWSTALVSFNFFLLKCNPDVLTMTSGQTLDRDVNKYEHRCFQEYDTVPIGIRVAEETGFSETSVFICPTTASHPISSSLHSA